jgi:hypothetical protein
MTLSNQKIMVRWLFVIIISCFLLSCSAHSISSVNKEQFIDYKKNINYSNGNDCLAMKKYDQAIESFSKAIDDMPNCDECYLKRGIANRLAWIEKSKIGPYLTYSRHPVHISTYYLKDAIKDFGMSHFKVVSIQF